MRLLERHEELDRLKSIDLPELGLTLSLSYDKEADILAVDFGLDEPTFD